ncbi:MAG: hypothetical protein A4S09_16255 [Proteobacteria bacterium SG_bin7]|nr:MAG: hypothetical protein A4S09_16255 [Proteobacteria bacterium SG_bin7]
MTSQRIFTLLLSLAVVASVSYGARADTNCSGLFLKTKEPKVFSYSKMISIRPRIGLETETARVNEHGKQVLVPPSEEERNQLTRQILSFWQSKFGGEIKVEQERDENGELEELVSLQTIPGKASLFRVDRDWASHSKRADAFEIVTPPLDEKQIKIYIDNYDQLLKTTGLGAGIKTSQQFNIELREPIPGFSLNGVASENLGFSYNSVKNVNISKIVDLFLFFETHVLEMYAAIAPKRLGNIVNHFQVPMIFEHEALLKELAALPVEARTYQRVRSIFVKYNEVEDKLGDYGDRTSWKYRPFNIRKFFEPGQEDLSWVYPALELRIPDTVEKGADLHKLLNLIYAAFNVGSNRPTTPDMISGLYQKYRMFFAKNRERMPFAQAMRVLNQDIALQIYSNDFQKNYQEFLKKLGLNKNDYPAFYKAEPAPYVSQTYKVYNMIGPRKEFKYAGRKITMPEIFAPESFKENVSFGLEFEYSNHQGLKEQLGTLGFLEREITVEEATGNHEIRTLPTKDLNEMFAQIHVMRDILGDSLKSIHLHLRTPKSIYENMERPTFDAWIGRTSDWIMSLRASYRQGRFAFRTRTQSRMRVDTPNSWIENDKNEYRGTMRVLVLGNEVDIEVRGLMNGVYTQKGLESDQFIVSTLVLLTGLKNPELIEGQYLNRVAMEVAPSTNLLKESMEEHAQAMGKDLESLPHSIDDLVSGLRLPNLMLLPLVGFHYSPMLSSHDIKKIQNANLNWQLAVWEILNDRSLDKENAREKFYESLKDWTRKSGIEEALFDSLLVQPAPKTSWSQLNLPKSEFQSDYMKKLLELEGSEFARASINLFLASWFHKDRKSFFAAALAMESDKKKLLVSILAPHETSENIRLLQSQLSVKAPKAVVSTSFKTNLTFLVEELKGNPLEIPPGPRSNFLHDVVERASQEVKEVQRSSDNWARGIIAELRDANPSQSVFVVSLEKIFNAAVADLDNRACISHRSKYLFQNIQSLYRLAEVGNFAFEEQWRLTNRWANYAVSHIEYSRARDNSSHIPETLRDIRSILPREVIRRYNQLHRFFDAYNVGLPPN